MSLTVEEAANSYGDNLETYSGTAGVEGESENNWMLARGPKFNRD